jgi:AcrR family transcriptional regulator
MGDHVVEDLRRSLELLWGSVEPPTRGPKPALSTERIVEAAIGIADTEGLVAVSMQRVASALAFTKMSLYRYFPGKTELVAVMIDTALGSPPAPGSLPGDWLSKLAEWAHRLWARYRQHPWLLPATVGRRALGPNELGWLETAVDVIAGTGLTGSEQLDTVSVVNGHIRNVAQQTMDGHDEQHLGSTITGLLRERTDRYPALAAAIADNASPDDALEFGLDRILAGIAQLVDGR